MSYPGKAIIKTPKYTFLLNVSLHRNPYTNELESITINLGGRFDKCVTISIPSTNTTNTDGTIASIEKKNDCSFDTPSDESGMSQYMLRLGLTIARDFNPAVKRFYFDDCSHVECEMPDGRIIPISLRNLNIAFHGSSWYEQHFDAKLVHAHEDYRKRIENFYKPEKKPATFHFLNSDLQEELAPVYSSTHTWADFFKAIRQKYGKKKCAVVYPWMMSALYHIFEGNSFDNMKWYIDVEENKAKNKTPLIPFKTYEVISSQKGASRRITRRHPKKQKTYPYTSFVMNPGAVMRYNYRTFLA